MGFFSELKNDLSQAVNTLMPDDKADETAALDSDKNGEGFTRGDKSEKVDIDSMLNKLDDIKLEEIGGETNEAEEPEKVEEPQEVAEEVVEEEAPKSALDVMAELKQSAAAEAAAEVELEELEEKIEEQTEAETEVSQPQSGFEAISAAVEETYVAQEPVERYVAEESASTINNSNNGGYETMDFEQQTPTDETASITEGMVITGDLQTTGSLDLIGKVTGNIKCLGKLNVTGEISGDSDAAEIYAESARITGEVRSKGSVKVGQSTVIVGNIFGSSAVIAGAVKGDIDVHGPVVLDTTAIVMGNIKSQSVQINNGAVIEGMCSQAYADVNPSEFFETLKNR
ncbi:polymer-forming cytoskeletal protein [Butyrivibrio sp. VCB2006]|uniref:polymer-forming cytoskeletal protein n=1 Tax=Butyrivibrio sp. VCB2006 TaxID=1280679 RepID=UPI0003FA0CD9|nr:polymer-forming cytoskeletal protein [Butyrivibrio sp. VCB2006]